MSRAACTCVAPALKGDIGGRGGSPSCIIVIRAASTIASESRLGCERTARGAWEEIGSEMSLSSGAVAEEVEAGGSPCGASPAESNMWLTTVGYHFA
jgi:hypothetical protein